MERIRSVVALSLALSVSLATLAHGQTSREEDLKKDCDAGDELSCIELSLIREKAGEPAPAAPKQTPPSAPASQGTACNKDSARLVGRAYVLSSPVSQGDLRGFLQANRAAFREDGSATRCAQVLGAALVARGMGMWNPHAYEQAMDGVGPAEYAPEVAASINSSSADLYAMGNELAWLAQVLPAAAGGNFVPFDTTGTPTRQQIRQAMAQLQQMAQVDPEFGASMQEALAGSDRIYGPLAEQQIAMLALMVE